MPDSIFNLGSEIRALMCSMCGKEGHEEKNCMQRMKTVIKVKHGHNRDVQSCYRCGDTGHWAKNCTELNTSKDTLRKNEGNGEVRRCYKCGQQGHEQSQCIRKPTLDDTTYAKSMKNPK